MKKKLKKINWKKISKVVLILQLFIFFIFGFYLLLKVRESIGPDEPYHLNVAKAYSKTWGVPENTPETYEFGDITSSNFFSHWLNARLLNINVFGISELHLLRAFGLLASVGTLFVVYELSKEIIKDEKLRVIPVILLANTLMFQFLSAVINYDNLTNFLAVLSILYIVKIVKSPAQIKNYTLWVIFSSLGVLAKYTLFPLVLIQSLLLLYILIKEKPKFDFKKSKLWLHLFLAVLFVLPVAFLYGKNVVNYKNVFPKCQQVMSVESCMHNGVFRRDYGQSAGIKVFSKEGVKMVFSWRWNPVKYSLKWIREMNMRIYGILAHKDMFIPHHLHVIFLLFPVSFSYLFLKNLKKRDRLDIYLMIIFLFYTFVLAFIQNYRTYLNRDGIIFALQGRYIFPVIAIYYTLLVKYIDEIKNSNIKKIFFIFLITMFLLASIPFFFMSVTPDWFV